MRVSDVLMVLLFDAPMLGFVVWWWCTWMVLIPTLYGIHPLWRRITIYLFIVTTASFVLLVNTYRSSPLLSGLLLGTFLSTVLGIPLLLMLLVRQQEHRHMAGAWESLI